MAKIRLYSDERTDPSATPTTSSKIRLFDDKQREEITKRIAPKVPRTPIPEPEKVNIAKETFKGAFSKQGLEEAIFKLASSVADSSAKYSAQKEQDTRPAENTRDFIGRFFLPEVSKNISEFSGIAPVSRFAAGTSAAAGGVPEEDIPETVQKYIGGVTQPMTSAEKTFQTVDILSSLPGIGLLAKGVSRPAVKGLERLIPETSKLVRPAIEVLPEGIRSGIDKIANYRIGKEGPVISVPPPAVREPIVSEPVPRSSIQDLPEVNPVFDRDRKTAKNVYHSIGLTREGDIQPKNAGLQALERQFETPQGKTAAQRELSEQINTGKVKPNEDGTITVYRGGSPKGDNKLVSVSTSREAAAEFGDPVEFRVKPEDVAAANGLDSGELLVSRSALEARPKPVVSPRQFFEDTPDVTVKEVGGLGVDGQGKRRTARLEWDSKTNTGTLFVTKKTSDETLAHEIAHYLDKKIAPEARDALMAEADQLAVKYKDATPNERFAEAVAKQIKEPDADKYPGINQLLRERGINTTIVIPEKSTKIPTPKKGQTIGRQIEESTVPVVEINKNLYVGEFGSRAQQAKATAGKGDRFDIKELPKTVDGLTGDVFRASNDPKNYRYGNRVRLAKFGSENRAIVTRTDINGREQIISWYKISNPNYLKELESYGRILEENRTPNLSGRNTTLNPLSYEDSKSISDKSKKVNEGSAKFTEGGKTPTGATKKEVSESYNASKINAPEDIQKLIENTAKADERVTTKQRRGSITNEQLKELSLMTGVKESDILKSRPGSIANAETALAARQVMLDAAKDLSETARDMVGRATPERLAQFKEKLVKFKALQQTIAGYRTEAGRLLQQYKIEVRPGENDVLNDLVEQVSKVDKGAADELGIVKELAKLTEPTNVSNLISLWKAGLLTNPTTHLANITGNTAKVFLKGVGDIPAVISDQGFSLITGKRSKSFSVSERFRGFVEGTREIPSVFRGGQGSKFIESHKEIKFKNKTVDKIFGGYARTVFNALEAADKPFYLSAYRASLEDQARVMAKNEGGKWQQHFSNPTDNMKMIATADAEKATFKKVNALTKAAASGKRSIGPLGEIIFPFTRTPGAIAKEVAIDYSPLGIPVEIFNQVKAKSFNQRQLSEAIGASVTGTALITLGWIMAKDKLMTGSYPTDPREQKLWEASGKQENSVLINGKWRQISRLSPLGNVIGVGAQMHEQAKTDGAKEAAASFLFTVGKSLSDMSFLQGMSQTLATLKDPEKEGSKWFNNAVAGLVPSLSGAIARGTDKYMRKPEKGIGTGTLQSVQARIPGLSQKVPVKKNVFQEPVKRQGGLPGQLLDIFRSSAKDNSAVIKEFDRLSDTGNIPALTDVTLTDRFKRLKTEKGVKTTEDAAAEFGKNFRKQAEQLVNSSAYRKLSDEKKKDEIDKLKNQIVDKLFNSPKYRLKNKK